MRFMNDKASMTFLQGLADELLYDKLTENKVWYNDAKIDFSLNTSPDSIQQATQNIGQVTEFRVFNLAGTGDFANKLIQFSTSKFATSGLKVLAFDGWK